jgi:hypothetical protein
MSVVKSKRGESDLAIINKSRELAVYTARICSNEKNFPKRYRWCITSKIVSDAFDIYGNIRKANTIFVKIRPDYDIRRQCQNKARGALDSLLKKLVDEGVLTKEHVDECYASWKAHAKQGNTYNLILSMNKFYKNLWKEGGNNV